MDEAQLFLDLKAGDRKAFDLLFDLLYEKVCFYTEHITKDEMEAEDIAVNSLVKFWERGPDTFESLLHVKNFIFRTAKNAALDFLKKNKIQRTHKHNLVYITTEFEENMAEVAERARYKVEMLQQLVDEIDNLPKQCSEIFRLVFIENMPRPNVAEKLAISLSTVHNQCAIAKQKLRQIFDERELIFLLLLIGLCPN